jgi:beta-N-acetylhexosaminidase
MPLERQIAQLFMVALPPGVTTSAAALGPTDWGGVVIGSSNFGSDSQIATLAAAITGGAQDASGVRPLIAAAQEGGRTSAIPDLPPQSEPTIGASGQPALARAQATLAGRRLRALGVNMTLAPLADVDTPGGAISDRLYSTDPGAVAAFSDAAVRGYEAAGIVSATGHFPGAGGASADPDQMSATVGGSLAALGARDLLPFATVATHAPVIVMSNAVYAAFDGVTPAGLLPRAVQLLRLGYGFQSVVMSDDLDAALQATGGDAGAAALAALQAGDTLLFISGSAAEQQSAYAAVLAAAGRSAALRTRVRAALLRVLTLKVKYGMVAGR